MAVLSLAGTEQIGDSTAEEAELWEVGVGGKWMFWVWYHPLSGPKCFGELQWVLPQTNRKMLAMQLWELERMGALYARLPNDDDRRLDWSRLAAQLRDLVRACAPKGARADVGGHTMLVRHVRIADAGTTAAPGTALNEAPLVVQTGDSALVIEHVASAEDAAQ